MEFKEQFIVKGFDYKGELVGEEYRENYPSEKSIGLFLKAHPTVDYCKVDKVFKKVRPYDEQRKKEQLVALQVAKEIAKSFVTCPACNKPIVEEATQHICKVTIPLTEEKDFDWDMKRIQDLNGEFASSKYTKGFAPLKKINDYGDYHTLQDKVERYESALKEILEHCEGYGVTNETSGFYVIANEALFKPTI